jgi:hypothetical protein
MENVEALQLGVQILQGGCAAVLVVLGWVWTNFSKYQEETRRAIRALEHAVIRLESQRSNTGSLDSSLPED